MKFIAYVTDRFQIFRRVEIEADDPAAARKQAFDANKGAASVICFPVAAERRRWSSTHPAPL